jgi:hypothetical protein
MAAVLPVANRRRIAFPIARAARHRQIAIFASDRTDARAARRGSYLEPMLEWRLDAPAEAGFESD